MSKSDNQVTSACTRDNPNVVCTVPWFINGTEYSPLDCTFKLLNCGEATFKELYVAIKAAKKSVSYLCWGFQPSMHFIRPGTWSIGELLENLAGKSVYPVQVRVLCWKAPKAFMFDPVGEPNTTWPMEDPWEADWRGWDHFCDWIGWKKLPENALNQMPKDYARHFYDQWWYLYYSTIKILDGIAVESPPVSLLILKIFGKDQKYIKDMMEYLPANKILEMDIGKYMDYLPVDNKLDGRIRSLLSKDFGHIQKIMKSIPNEELAQLSQELRVRQKNLEVRTRDFSVIDRAALGMRGFEHAGLSAEHIAEITAYPTHHQNVVLIDAELPDDHVAFVLGSNTLDSYWDTPLHSYARKPYDQGRNGHYARQDLSCRITGPLVGDLYKNFKSAWERAPDLSYVSNAVEKGIKTGKKEAMTKGVIGLAGGPLAAAAAAVAGFGGGFVKGSVKGAVETGKELALDSLARSSRAALPEITDEAFRKYPLYSKKLQACEPFSNDTILKSHIGELSTDGAHLMRTSARVGDKRLDIEKAYLHVTRMATRYLYIENEHFRWKPLADEIVKAAQVQTSDGRDPAGYGSLYVFVVTNSSEAGMGEGTQQTYRMLDSLGRRDAMPGVSWNNLDPDVEEAQKELEKANQAIEDQRKDDNLKHFQNPSYGMHSPEKEELRQKYVNMDARVNAAKARLSDLSVRNEAISKNVITDEARRQLDEKVASAEKSYSKAQEAFTNQQNADQHSKSHTVGSMPHLNAVYDRHNANIAAAKKRLEEIRAQRDAVAQKAIVPEERPGLKIHVCTLVSPDTAEGMAWPEVYVHSKLLLINDTYMNLGSARISYRSMEVDTELNIAHARVAITQKARRELWAQHTGGRGAQDDMKVAFKEWAKIIDKNRDNEKYKRKPTCSLRGFLRTDPTITNRD